VAAAADTEGDLIDFGDDDDPPNLQQPLQPGPPSRNGEVDALLKATGTAPPPSDALHDFQKDLKRDLPAMERSDTDGSKDDEFHDAEG